ncbi:hypothetical protein [Methanosarcina barkeri]|nr:hypothetical protein [Methanosarcina barkeri]
MVGLPVVLLVNQTLSGAEPLVTSAEKSSTTGTFKEEKVKE